MSEKNEKTSAEMAFRDAFDRLKKGNTKILKKGSRVSQNNVAKEAGVDPSALRKTRFPSLVAEIQRYLAEHQDKAPRSERQKHLAYQVRNRKLLDRLEMISKQRDHLASLLNEANSKIITQAQQIADLEAKLPPSNVAKLF